MELLGLKSSMGEYKPPFTITNKVLTYVSSISEKIGRIAANSSLEAKPYLRRNSRIKSIHMTILDKPNSRNQRYVRR